MDLLNISIRLVGMINHNLRYREIDSSSPSTRLPECNIKICRKCVVISTGHFFDLIFVKNFTIDLYRPWLIIDSLIIDEIVVIKSFEDFQGVHLEALKKYNLLTLTDDEIKTLNSIKNYFFRL